MFGRVSTTVFACTLINFLLQAASPTMAAAQDVFVMPLTTDASGAVAPDGSGFVLFGSSVAVNRYAVAITSADGMSSAVITVGNDGSFAATDQMGNSGYVVAAPVAIERDGDVAYAFTVCPSGVQEAQSYSSASRSWLDSYAEWFNGTFGSGWSEMAGGVIHDVITTVVSDETLANTSDGTLLTGTVIVSVPVAVGIVYGGEVVLGVGTFGGEAAGGLTAAQIEINAAYQEIVLAQQQIAALEATQAQLLAGPATAIEVGGYEAYAAARLETIAEAIASREALIELNWTWIDLLLPGI
jgi:hypothetical protein